MPPIPSSDRMPQTRRRQNSPEPAKTHAPTWWRADEGRFEALADKRTRIHDHEQAVARNARSVIAAGLLAAVSIYSVDATGAMAITAGSGILLFLAAIALPAVVAWLLDRRLLQQLQDIHLRSELWLDLVDAVKHDHIDVAQLGTRQPSETEIEMFLRREAALAARFLASRKTLAPHLPIFGHCFTLENS